MNTFKKLLTDIKSSLGFWVETAKLDFATAVLHEIHDKQINHKQLAEKMAVSPAMVTRIVKGDHNATIETMAKVAFAMDKKLSIQFIEPDKPFQSNLWKDNQITIKTNTIKTSKQTYHHLAPIKKLKPAA